MPSAGSANEPMVPVLFDTDIGSDIDDALALAYLLAEPRCELVGITTATGEPQDRARLADAVCRAAGRTDVAIHSGVEPPILGTLKQPHAEQKSVLPRWAHQSEFAPNTAVPFMREVVRARPGEIMLLAVGPLTNVGLLFAIDPEVPRLLKRLVIMGGIYTSRPIEPPWTEWNLYGDPHAAALAFRAPVPEITAFGLDVTLRCDLSAEECRRRFQGGALDVVADAAEVWFTRTERIVFHDPLAAVAIFHPDVCDYQRGRVEVDLAGEVPDGKTHWSPDPAGPHHVAVEVVPERFFGHYFNAFR